jgi:NACHT domain
MSEPEQQSLSSRRESHLLVPWWVRLCRILWKIFAVIGTTVVLGAIASLIATWLTSSKGVIPADSPLRQVLAFWPIALPTGCSLLLLAILTWMLSRWPVQDAISTSFVQQNRELMLRRLRRMYPDILEQSLQEVAWIDLGFAQRPDAVRNAASLLVHFAHRAEQLLPLGTPIKQVYEDAAHELLILGEPGAGKSTLLVTLAEQLVEQAEKENAQPLPVYLPLSSWAVRRPPFHDWLAEQVAEFYDISKKVTQQWIHERQLLLLLDGLDEMEEIARPACIVAINDYHHAHPGSLVVCSRKAEYEDAAKQHRLNLQNAVVVQPLSPEQIDAYLVQAGKPLKTLRHILTKDSELQELASTPLMLSILMLTYQGTLASGLSKKEVELQQQVWADYVQRMVESKGDASHYPLHRTITWLSWLARELQQHNQPIFHLEQLQPDWLPERQRFFYRWSVRIVVGLVGGLVGGLGGGLLFGLVGGLLFGLFFGLGDGLVVGLDVKIEPAEVLTWSWKNARVGLFVGLFVGLVGGLFVGLVVGLFGGLVVGLGVGLLFVLLFVLLGGLSGEQLVERLMLSPNEGIRRSARNGLLFGLFVGLFFGLGVGLVVGLFGGLVVGLFGGLVGGLFVGLGAVAKHFVLRFWLRQTHAFPWKAQQFLDDSTARILLRRIGGGYSFVHRLLLNYFVDLNSGSAPISATTSTARSAPRPTKEPSA